MGSAQPNPSAFQPSSEQLFPSFLANKMDETEFTPTATPFKIGHVRTPDEVRLARREQAIMQELLEKEFTKIAKEMEEMFPKETAARREAARIRAEQALEVKASAPKTDYFAEWPALSQERARKAPSVRGVRRPHDGPEDYFGTRAQGARFHSHYLPVYPLGTPRSVVLRDYVMDLSVSDMSTYIRLCIEDGVDPKSHPVLYRKMLWQLVVGLSQTFVENTTEREYLYGGQKDLDMLIKVLITSPTAHDTIKDELLDNYSYLLETLPESEHEPADRKNLYEIMVTTMMEFFRCDARKK